MDSSSKVSLWAECAIFMATVAFCAFSWKVMVQPRVAAKVAVVERTPVSERAPASLYMANGAEERSTKVWEIGCLGSGSGEQRPLSTEAGLLRIIAQLCEPYSSVTATNTTTKEQLLIFQAKEKVSTHYFPLKEGKNLIVFDWNQGKRREQVEVVRTGGEKK